MPSLDAIGPVRHDAGMTHEEPLALLAQHKPVLAERFGVGSLKLFGSFGRETAGADSDVDVLVDFGGPATPEAYSACSSTSRTFWAAASTSSPNAPCGRPFAPMSNAMPLPSPERDERLYVADMLQSCERAMVYTSGRRLEEMLAEPMRYDATLRILELIGEAATHVSAELLFPEERGLSRFPPVGVE